MADIIKLLPDAVANQIAAGEVVQRPASAVKELIENAIDSGASDVQLIVKDAGKTLMQIIDNGCGMSDTDARMSFERHATSKIRNAEELWQIRTKGFRGEALASIAAIAQVELKTRLRENELGSRLVIAGSKVELQEPCSTPGGTSVAVKNLFFNTPARRNFLKSDPVEMRHIIEEFERVALAHPGVGFGMFHNGSELFNLKASQLRQRIVNIFGHKHNERLVPVNEDTAIVSVSGFICKPEYAKKTRGEQYFFVNDRFIKNPYLHHAVVSAFQDLIARDAHPSYFIYLRLDPSSIDINIHPTKTEVKFAEERSIYAIIRSAVRNSLGKYNISPSIDFDQENIFNLNPLPANISVAPPERKDYDFNPFDQPVKGVGSLRAEPSFGGSQRQLSAKGWENLYSISRQEDAAPQQVLTVEAEPAETDNSNRVVFQLHRKYILTQIKSGLVIIDQQRAHERILYEKALSKLQRNQGSSQQLLFPQTLELSPADRAMITDLAEPLNMLGFTIDSFGGDTVVINGIPSEAINMPIQTLIETMLEQYKHSAADLQTNMHERLAMSMARSLGVKEGRELQPREMLDLIDSLFACEQPQLTPNGKPIVVTFTTDELDKKFKA